ncbi:MAG: hypothetical protein ACXVCJ_07600 [Polyangiales bacterium]
MEGQSPAPAHVFKTHVPPELHRMPFTHSASLLHESVHDAKGPHSNVVGHAAAPAQLQMPPGPLAAQLPLAQCALV